MAKLRGVNKDKTIKELQDRIIEIRRLVDNELSPGKIFCNGKKLLKEIDKIIMR